MVNSSRKRKLGDDSSEDSALDEPIQVRSPRSSKRPRKTLKRFGNAAQLNISESDENDPFESEDDYSPQPKNQKTTQIEKPIEKRPNFMRNFDHEFDKLGSISEPTQDTTSETQSSQNISKHVGHEFDALNSTIKPPQSTSSGPKSSEYVKSIENSVNCSQNFDDAFSEYCKSIELNTNKSKEATNHSLELESDSNRNHDLLKMFQQFSNETTEMFKQTFSRLSIIENTLMKTGGLDVNINMEMVGVFSRSNYLPLKCIDRTNEFETKLTDSEFKTAAASIFLSFVC